MARLAFTARTSLISWFAAVMVGALVGWFFLDLYWPPNNAEWFVSIGTSVAIMVVLRRIVASELEKRNESE